MSSVRIVKREAAPHLPRTRNAAFIPMSKAQGLSAAAIGKTCLCSVRYYFTSEGEGSLAVTLGVGSRIIFMPYFGRMVTLGWSTTGKPGTRRGV